MARDIDDIKTFDVSLQYLTHDARTVVEGVGLSDLKLYDQICLMVWCYNYNASRVLTSLKKHLAERGKQRPNRKHQPKSVVDHADGTNSYHVPNEFVPDNRVIKSVSSRALILEAAHNERRFFGTPTHKAFFSFNAIKNLYSIDRLVLYADYNVRLDVLANALDQMSRDSINGLASEVGKMNMELFLFKLQDRLAVKNKFRKDMTRPNEKINHGPKMSEAGREKLKGLLQDIREVRTHKERGEKGE